MKKIPSIFFLFFFMVSSSLGAISYDRLCEVCPDAYTIPGQSDDQEILIGCHGFGMNAEVIDFLEINEFAPHHLVGFNFPNYGHGVNDQSVEELKFGTIWELEPLLKILKQCVVDGKQKSIHLYGFSAGGGAVINAIAVLWQYRFPHELAKMGISVEARDEIIHALQNGTVTLDLPLKSVEEVLVNHLDEATENLLICIQNYKKNDLRPIDSLCKLKGVSLNVLLHFQEEDVILSNRDDDLYIERLSHANLGGVTHIVIGKERLHAPCLPSVLDAYRECFSHFFNDEENAS